ncbi:Linoleate 9/13-lipoxygenase [Escovopsis weberi]|uniref:Manganese lipoxygenase n=1 Tax=Escovopsis weberi TaxID=150374 RepID=A0A0M8MWZ3_ESCWE|nr:Linoleate 9/13-lipoxygenase [Escovopsis weberi]
MKTQAACLLLGSCLASTAVAAPSSSHLDARSSHDASASAASAPASLPQNDPNTSARQAEIAARAKGFVYGPSLIGEAAPFPNGTLGNQLSQGDMDLWAIDRADIDQRTALDVAALQPVLVANGGLKSLDDYTHLLYDGQWQNVNPRGVAPGIMTNYTQDLLFSMERVSQNPYSLTLVKPGSGLPFAVDDDTARQIAGATLEELQAASHLFYVDYTSQLHYPKTQIAPARFGAACSAYFYIHPASGDFLPLAIKTNVGSDLVYTPLDSANDWLLAKMMFNVNDLFHSQMLHLVITHDVSEAVHQAALHTLSPQHPVQMILDRLMLQGYSSRIVGEQLCFNEGGHWDQLMYVNNTGCRQFVTESWPTAGRFQAGYLRTDLQARGLLDGQGNYPFKAFPFYDDASRIHDAYRAFFTSFVDSYYASDADVAKDAEVNNWFVEATANAGVQDFPRIKVPNRPAVDKATLVDVLTHFGFIVSVGHHSLNGGDPIGSKATLPFHLPALFADVPAEKGVQDLLPFLPQPDQAVHYIGFIGSFNRPFYPTSNRTLEDAFLDQGMLSKLNAQTRTAAQTFLDSMQALSDEIHARGFDADGLSTGMPFVYRTLDPAYIPFFCAV